MKNSILAVALILAASFAVKAQQSFDSDIAKPQEVKRRFNNSAGRSCVEYTDNSERCLGESAVVATQGIICAASDKDCRGKKPPHLPFRRVADRAFWLTITGHVLASLYDGETTHWCIHHTLRCREANPLFGRRPSRLRMYVTLFAIEGVTQDYVTYWLKRDDDEHRAYIRDGLPFRHCKRKGDFYECHDEPAKMPAGGPWWFWGNLWTAEHVAFGSYNVARLK